MCSLIWTQSNKDQTINTLTTHSPEQAFPGREVGALEKSVLQDTLNTAQCLDHVCTVVVQIPQLPVMTLVSPPERVLLQDLQTNTHTYITNETKSGDHCSLTTDMIMKQLDMDYSSWLAEKTRENNDKQCLVNTMYPMWKITLHDAAIWTLENKTSLKNCETWKRTDKTRS